MLTSDERKGGGNCKVRGDGSVELKYKKVFMGFTKSLVTCISNPHIYSRVYHLLKLLNRILYLDSLKLFLSNVNIYSFVITILHFSRHSFKFVFNW